MKQLILIIYFALIVIGFTSCNPDVNIENIAAEELLCVTSFISPQDSALSVYVYRSRTSGEVAGRKSVLEKNATVTISDGTKEVSLKFDSLRRTYNAINPFGVAKDGTIFELRVSAPDGVKVSAKSVLPPKPAKPTVTGKINGNLYEFEMVWQNDIDYHFYDLEGELCSDLGDSLYYYLGNNLNVNFDQDPYDYMPSDMQLKGTNMVSGYTDTGKGVAGLLKVSFRVVNVEESKFNYKKTYREYRDWGYNAVGGIIPNFRSPVRVFSNIEGGFGVFTSQNASEPLVIILK